MYEGKYEQVLYNLRVLSHKIQIEMYSLYSNTEKIKMSKSGETL